jgi:hypothetical protein
MRDLYDRRTIDWSSNRSVKIFDARERESRTFNSVLVSLPSTSTTPDSSTRPNAACQELTIYIWEVATIAHSEMDRPADQ